MLPNRTRGTTQASRVRNTPPDILNEHAKLASPATKIEKNGNIEWSDFKENRKRAAYYSMFISRVCFASLLSKTVGKRARKKLVKSSPNTKVE